LNGISSEEAIIFWMINIESLREIQQVSPYNATADVLVFKLSDVICLVAGFAILTVLNKVTGGLYAAEGGTEN